MRIYGLTGGIGSGKSEVAKRFAELGFPVIEADAIGHALIAQGGEAESEVIAAFGEGILTCGKINRKKLGAVVFSDATALDRLNALVHPALKRTIRGQCAELAERGHNAAIVNAAILADDGRLDPWLDGLIVVVSSEEERHRRLVQLRGMSPEEARQRMNAQTPPESKLALADWVIGNDGTLDELRAKVDRVAEQINKRNSGP